MDNNIIDEIRRKVDIVDVISSYLPLTQKGKNFFGVCPFHDDTNPSMSVSREKQIYRCFSCGASGNVFGFIENYEHVSFKEALRLLANKVGIELKGIKISEKTDKNQKLYEIYDIANKYFQNNIHTNYGKKAKTYLYGRQINDDMIKEYGIGLSLDQNNDLTNLLTKKGYDLNTLNLIGLSSYDHDLYKSRIMFPLKDLNGRIVGFSGRRYDGIKEEKYINTKQTPIFQKGTLLYNYFDARESIRQKNQVIVMEGFMAVIRSSTIGVKNAIALMGTAMTKEQAELIKRLSHNVILMFDGDDAGRKATLTNGEELEKLGLNVKVAELDGGLDPDDFILKNGKDEFYATIDSAINYSDYKIKSLKKGTNLNSDEEIAEYINKVLIEVSKMNDEIHQELILKTLAKEFNIGYNTLEKRLLSFKEKQEPVEKIIPNQNTETKKNKLNKYDIAAKSLLYYMLIDDKTRNLFETGKINFPAEKERFLASEIIYYKNMHGTLVIADFYTYLQDKEELLKVLNDVMNTENDDVVDEKVILDCIQVLNEKRTKQEMNRLKQSMLEKKDPLEKAKIAEQIRKLKMGS